MRRMKFNDGEGITYEDLNMIGQLGDRALTRYALSNVCYQTLLEAGTGTMPLFVRGTGWAHSGTGNRTFTWYNSLWCQFQDGFDNAFDLGDDDGDLMLLVLPETSVTFDAPTSGSVYRRDIIQVQAAAELDTESESRDFKDATTGVVTTQSMNKRRVRRMTMQVVKGTDQVSESLADANEPAVTAGWTKIFSCLIPPTGSLSATKDREHFLCYNARRIRVTGFDGPAIQGAHNANGYWASTNTTHLHQVPIPLESGDRILRVKWLYRNDANPGANKEFSIRSVLLSGAIAAVGDWTSLFTGTPSAIQNFTQGRATSDTFIKPYTVLDTDRLMLAAFQSGGISDRFYVAELLIDTPLYF